jgi:hypothetical protein
MIGGVGARQRTSRAYVDLFVARHRAMPGRSWLWTRDPDAEVEQLRRRTATATLVAIVGLVVLLAGLYSP